MVVDPRQGSIQIGDMLSSKTITVASSRRIVGSHRKAFHKDNLETDIKELINERTNEKGQDASAQTKSESMVVYQPKKISAFKVYEKSQTHLIQVPGDRSPLLNESIEKKLSVVQGDGQSIRDLGQGASKTEVFNDLIEEEDYQKTIYTGGGISSAMTPDKDIKRETFGYFNDPRDSIDDRPNLPESVPTMDLRIEIGPMKIQENFVVDPRATQETQEIQEDLEKLYSKLEELEILNIERNVCRPCVEKNRRINTQKNSRIPEKVFRNNDFGLSVVQGEIGGSSQVHEVHKQSLENLNDRQKYSKHFSLNNPQDNKSTMNLHLHNDQDRKYQQTKNWIRSSNTSHLKNDFVKKLFPQKVDPKV